MRSRILEGSSEGRLPGREPGRPGEGRVAPPLGRSKKSRSCPCEGLFPGVGREPGVGCVGRLIDGRDPGRLGDGRVAGRDGDGRLG